MTTIQFFDIISNVSLSNLQYTKLSLLLVPSFMTVLPGLVAVTFGIIMHIRDYCYKLACELLEREYEQKNPIIQTKVTARDMMQPVKLLSGPDFGMFDKESPFYSEKPQISVYNSGRMAQILPAILVVVEEEPDMLPYIEEEGIEEGGLLAYCELFIKSDSKFNGQMLPA